MLLIPPESLSKETLEAILQEFITREGTDYGSNELSLEDKCKRLQNELRAGRVRIVFDELSESVNLIPEEEYLRLESE